MRFGIVILPQFDWPDAARYWRGAEDLGFDHAWTYDHLSWRGLAGERWHATVPTLTAAATVTSRVGLGTFVTSPNFRHPVPFAKDLGTLDDIAGGRVLLGVGSGGTGFDAHVLGQAPLTPRERHARFVEFTEALDRLLRFEEPGSGGISFTGDWYTADAARMVGSPAQSTAQSPRMPLHVAANGPRGLAFTTRIADGWITTGPEVEDTEQWWASIRDLSSALDDACAAADRDPATLDRTLSLDAAERYSLASVDAFEDAVGRARELGFTDVVSHWPRRDGLYAGDESVLEEVAGRFAALRAAA
ncbi:LLM class flavin-dependent oxidoreductase [Agromyces sp. LHK192]|uniref:LLM class flavin-dependent oxidoreductase n=1 Tax=Agromyces sp. LHK192 TaxID=2498704 RepID=UPI000FD7AD19|nr:LLM class flavin-dependent oxidoreductase [Agromyces sp. LHK192]